MNCVYSEQCLRTVKSRAIFSPEEDAAKKRRSRGPGRPRSVPKERPEVPLRNLLEDEDAEDGATKAALDSRTEGKAAGGANVTEGQRLAPLDVHLSHLVVPAVMNS